MELLILGIMFAFIPAIVASSRGRNAGMYFLGGLLCWPIALVVCLCKINLKEETCVKPNSARFRTVTIS